jgi:hypothetical protein
MALEHRVDLDTGALIVKALTLVRQPLAYHNPKIDPRHPACDGRRWRTLFQLLVRRRCYRGILSVRTDDEYRVQLAYFGCRIEPRHTPAPRIRLHGGG